MDPILAIKPTEIVEGTLVGHSKRPIYLKGKSAHAHNSQQRSPHQIDTNAGRKIEKVENRYLSNIS